MSTTVVLPGSYGPSFLLTRLLGIPISVHWSLLVMLVLGFLRALPRGPLALALQAIFVLLAATSILLHELGHVLAARRFGHPVVGVELHAFGGLTHLSGQLPPRHGLLVSLAGPACSLGLFALFSACLFLVSATPVRWALIALSRWNLTLGLLNLLPVLPLDGGSALLTLLEALRGPIGAYCAYTISFWVSATATVLCALFHHIVGVLFFLVCCHTSHAYRNHALGRLDDDPPWPF